MDWIHVIIQFLNQTYDIEEDRPFWKVRGTTILLFFLYFFLIVGSLNLIVAGDSLEEKLSAIYNLGFMVVMALKFLRWPIITTFLLLSYALTYYYAPNVIQE